MAHRFGSDGCANKVLNAPKRLQIHAGGHAVDLRINGVVRAKAAFELQLDDTAGSSVSASG